MSISTGGMTASYQVGFVTNLLEKLYKDSDHNITLTENQNALATDSKVAALSQQSLQNNLLTTDADKQAATATQKLYDKKSNFDKTFAALFANDTDGVDINDVRKLFGANIDQDVFGGLPMEKVIDLRTTLANTQDTAGVKALDLWVHAQGSHEGDLVGPDGQRINAISALQSIDPDTGTTIETKEQAAARSADATAKAPANNPTGALVSRQAFKSQLNRELSGQIDPVFVNSEITGHTSKADFIQNVLVGKMGATDVQSAADANRTIADNASQFIADYGKIGDNYALINRTDAARYFQSKAGDVTDPTNSPAPVDPSPTPTPSPAPTPPPVPSYPPSYPPYYPGYGGGYSPLAFIRQFMEIFFTTLQRFFFS